MRKTLVSLAECRKPEIYCGTIVVENGPRAGAQDVVRQAPRNLSARYVYEIQGNKSAALNKVLKDLNEGLIFFTDDDVRLDPDILALYAEASAATEHGCFYGGPVGVDYEVPPLEWLKPYLPASARGWAPHNEWKPDGREYFLGFNWAAFAADLKDAGGFDIDKGPGSRSGSTGQETDMQMRLLRNGLYGIYLPAAWVWHYVPSARCSPRWALKRNFREGISIGLDTRRADPAIFGYPLWTFKQLAKRTFEALCASLSRDPRTRFESYSELVSLCGYMRGARIKNRGAANYKSRGARDRVPPAR